MKLHSINLLAWVLSIFAVLSVAMSYASALDKQIFFGRLKQELALDNISLNSDNVEQKGQDIIIHDVTASIEDQPLNISDIYITNPQESSNGYVAEQIKIAHVSMDVGDQEIKFSDLNFFTVTLVNGDNDQLTKLSPYKTISIGNVDYLRNKKKLLSFSQITKNETIDEQDKSIQTSLSIADLSVLSSSSLFNSADDNYFKEINAESLHGNFTLLSNWNSNDGTLTLDSARVEFDGLGAINLSFNIGGLTFPVVKDLQGLKSNGVEDKLLKTISVNSVSVDYKDLNLLDNILSYYAKSQGISKQALIAQVKAIIPLLGTQLENNDFASELTDQINNFLDHRDTLKISAQPKAPLALSLIIATSAIAPQNLINLMNVHIKAKN